MSKNQIDHQLVSEEATAILESVFGESLEISPHVATLPEPTSEPVAKAKAKANESNGYAPSSGHAKSGHAKSEDKFESKKPKKKKKKKKDNAKNSQPMIENESTDVETSTMPVPVSASPEPGSSFADLPLRDEVQLAVQASGYKQPTPIQAEIIPHFLNGRDVLAQSQTGTGKTAAFALPILSNIEMSCEHPQVLILVPTRELAIQVASSFEQYGSHLPDFKQAVIYGGQDYEKQYRQLRKRPQVIVGTPGRLIDHIKNDKLDVSQIKCLVLDEADEMLNMGFIGDVQFVLDRASNQRQIALFSATLPEPIRKISQQYLSNPAKITIKRKTLTADSIRQRAVLVSPRDRVDVLIRFLEAEQADASIVFTRTREATGNVADKLIRAGFKAFALNGELPQRARERAIEKLKAGHLDILVATDIAARGLDVPRISHVFNYDLPEGPESYTHRIGRTGRAGKKGEAIVLLAPAQKGRLRFIEKVTRQKIEIVNPPSTDEINAMRVKKFYAEINETIANRDMTFFQGLVDDFIESSDQSVEKIAAAIAMVSQGDRDFLMKERPARPSRDRDESGGKAGGGHRKRSFGPPEAGMTRFRLAVGRQDGVRPGNIVGAVSNEGDIPNEQIGAIRIHQSFSTIDLPTDRAEDILERLHDTRVSGRLLRIRPYEDRKPGRRNGGGSGGGGSRGKSFGRSQSGYRSNKTNKRHKKKGGKRDAGKKY